MEKGPKPAGVGGVLTSLTCAHLLGSSVLPARGTTCSSNIRGPGSAWVLRRGGGTITGHCPEGANVRTAGRTGGQAPPRRNMASPRPGIWGCVPGTPAEGRLGEGGQVRPTEAPPALGHSPPHSLNMYAVATIGARMVSKLYAPPWGGLTSDERQPSGVPGQLEAPASPGLWGSCLRKVVPMLGDCK